MSLRELIEKRSRLTASMRQLIDAPKGQAGDLSDDQQQEFDRMKGEAETLERQITRQQTVDDMDRRAAGTAITSTGDDRFDEQCRNFSIVRAIAGAAGLDVDDGPEREVSKELNRRAGRALEGIQVPFMALEKRVTMTTNGGGALIPTDTRGFVDLLRPRMITTQLGATFLGGLTGNIAIPRRTKSTVAQWVNENEPLNFSDQEFDSIPLGLKTVGAITELSRPMLLQRSEDIEQLTRNDLLSTVAQAFDYAALFGSGVGAVPRGIYNDPDVPTVVMSNPPTWDEVLAFTSFVEVNDIEGTGWAMHPGARALLRSTIKASGEAAGFLMDETGRSLAGYPVAMSSGVPSNLGAGTNEGAVIFGRFSDLLICTWGESFSLLTNPYESMAYRKGNVQVRVMISGNVAVRHPESFAKGSVILP